MSGGLYCIQSTEAQLGGGGGETNSIHCIRVHTNADNNVQQRAQQTNQGPE